MKIEVRDLSTFSVIPVNVDCEHDPVSSFEDFWDGFEGKGEEIMLCKLCGLTWTPRAFYEQFDNDGRIYDE